MALAVFRHALRVFLGLLPPGGASLAIWRCHDCPKEVDTLRSPWLSTNLFTRAAFTSCDTAVNHAIRAALLGARYTSTL